MIDKLRPCAQRRLAASSRMQAGEGGVTQLNKDSPPSAVVVFTMTFYGVERRGFKSRRRTSNLKPNDT